MPYVNVKVIENVFSPEEKAQMIQGITEAVVAVEGEGVRPYTVVVLEEVRSGDWAFGGQHVSTTDVHTLRGIAPLSATG